MTKYGMAIDTKRCVACNRCSMACKIEHNLPLGMLWNCALYNGADYLLVPQGTYEEGLKTEMYTLACQHCDNPACVGVCPTGATTKREDGIVTVDYEKCIGCESCIAACPYTGVRTNADKPAWPLDFKVGDATVPDVVANTVSKCTFCIERIDRGERPACVDICYAYARYFGDLDDPESEISKVLAQREYDLLLEDQGTKPNVYFLK